VDLQVTVNGVDLRLGDAARPEDLNRAGLGKVPLWRRWIRGGGDVCWQAADPRVVCFDGSVEIYPCRHGYLDPDRRWGTACVVAIEDHRVERVEIRVIDGKYAAGNLFGRFVEAGCEMLGEPAQRDPGMASWRPNGWLVEAVMAPDAVNAAFHLERAAVRN